MSENEMIVVDGDSPPPLTNLSIKTPEPPTASDETMSLLPTLDPQSKMAQIISKETRKLRKRKVLPRDEVSDVNDDTPPNSTDNSSSDEIDEVDTDDMLDTADLLPPLRNKRANMTTAQLLNSAAFSKNGKRRRGRGRVAKTKKKVLGTKRRGRQPYIPPRRRIDDYVYDPEAVDHLAKLYPDTYWRFHADTEYAMLDVINEDHPLTMLGYHISDQAAIVGMTLSPDGTLLATFSSVGAIKLWDVTDEFKMVRRLRDAGEKNIEEYYCGQFVENQELLVTGGKLKDRFRWSAQDEDNHILPCPVKIFNIESGQRVSQLEGHAEEILCIKALKFKGKNYYITTSQDGYIIKWHMDEDWTTLTGSTKMEDGITCMAFTISFLPNTGNKFFVSACDGHLRLYDFEEALLLQTFEDMYSSYCDCGKFVRWLDAPAEDGSDDQRHAYFISRGAEMCDIGEGISSIPNTCTLHKLTFPSSRGGKFQLDQVKRFTHEDYHANSWLVKITSNGRYLLAPTIYGQIFVFNMSSGQLTAILKEHEGIRKEGEMGIVGIVLNCTKDMEVRDVIFHPYRPLLFSCGDDGSVKIYTAKV
ncbi:WD40-repeat-containing domain protein [Fennellomyces sp. T-0311]|nr:WD40-repeat-containing domain protein [Fennellomyces sp. T-0311]